MQIRINRFLQLSSEVGFLPETFSQVLAEQNKKQIRLLEEVRKNYNLIKLQLFKRFRVEKGL